MHEWPTDYELNHVKVCVQLCVKADMMQGEHLIYLNLQHLRVTAVTLTSFT